tara:strand:+ start:351 stop:602 length:252 start_codon:yes stop_codon:yes gene_type:complete
LDLIWSYFHCSIHPWIGRFTLINSYGVIMKKTTFIYDLFWCFRKIEEKRDHVSYKYGQQLKLSVNPSIDPLIGRAGFELTINY